MPMGLTTRMRVGGGAVGQATREEGKGELELHGAFLSLVCSQQADVWLGLCLLLMSRVCFDLGCALSRRVAKYLLLDAAPGFVVAKRVGVSPLSEKPAPVLIRQWRRLRC